jgi:hypothetical protein
MGDFDEWVAKYMGYVDRAISMVPYKRLAIFKEFFFNPVETIRKDDVGIGQRLKDMYVLNSVSLALSILAMLPLMLVSALFNPAAGMIYLMIFAAEYAFLLALGPIIGFLYSLLELLVAKLLGGTGDMRSNFNASALPVLAIIVVMLPVSVATIPLSWISAIPFVSLCTLCITLPLSVVAGVAWLYSYYLRYLAFKEVHKLSSLRAAGVVILPVVAIIALVGLVVLLAYAAIIAWFMGLYTAGAGAGTALPG